MSVPNQCSVKFNDAYYEADERNHPTGEAYCMHCWETDVVKHHLHRWHENERVNICSHCETKDGRQNNFYISRRVVISLLTDFSLGLGRILLSVFTNAP